MLFIFILQQHVWCYWFRFYTIQNKYKAQNNRNSHTNTKILPRMFVCVFALLAAPPFMLMWHSSHLIHLYWNPYAASHIAGYQFSQILRCQYSQLLSYQPTCSQLHSFPRSPMPVTVTNVDSYPDSQPPM